MCARSGPLFLLLVVLPLFPLSLTPQGPARAGEVTALLPVARVERTGSAPFEAKLNDPVLWRDWMATETGGRARLSLLDGSVLNLGSAARLQVVQHDPASQVTELELQLR